MELLTITLAANETKQFAKAGRNFEIIDSVYPLRVDFVGDQGQQTDSMVNALSGLYLEDPFSAFSITNGATAQSVTLLIIEAGRGGSRRQPGIVRVVDQSIDKTAAGAQFLGSATNGRALIKFNLVGIKAGTKSIILKRLLVSSTTSGQMALYRANADATLDAVVSAGFSNNKLFGGAASLASSVIASSAAAGPTALELPGILGLVGLFLNANSLTEVPLTSPILLLTVQ